MSKMTDKFMTEDKPASLDTILEYMGDNLLAMNYREVMDHIAGRISTPVQELALDHYLDTALCTVLHGKKASFLKEGRRVLTRDVVNFSKEKGLPFGEAFDHCVF